ncbi:Molybdopterin or thiamine biosynthesis adenylyltransferase [Chryseobacterium taeanense]|uniref:Molybdopterin or thiamine biosynthesis adenylyltransferase n=1 Tax=Chryseobacterium taeanense TaxID=311334 RepID=A0A1G8J2I3_9FLAO|nr:ThiF family adenylyltransferase [Chryseobacterium taeanense]SDI25167.1 Molybdopterin or thiamine biosynthesis adenylyltransferase [Chryseobacterium taeanense]
MEKRYSRNRLYLTSDDQDLLKNYPIFLGGAGIGSIIAETLLRFGFETITIVDGDTVELSNLNRQNYTEKDIAKPKVEALKKRLLSINSHAKISIHNCFINSNNLHELIKGHKIAINALDFSSDIPLLFDQVCQENGIPVLHPYNLGWGALVMVISENLGLDSLKKEKVIFNEVNVVQYVSSHMRYWGNPQKWLEDIIDKYVNENKQLPPPQLSIASFMAAAICTKIAFNIATNQPVKKFPEFYLTTLDL